MSKKLKMEHPDSVKSNWHKEFIRKLEEGRKRAEEEEFDVVMKGQYKEAYDLLEDALNADPPQTPLIEGPPGVGKSVLARKFARDTGRPFYEVFFDETIRPAYLIGIFDPALFMKGREYRIDAFEPGPLFEAMMNGGVFVAHELNRATEFCQNTLHSVLEKRERICTLPKRIELPNGQYVKMLKAHEDFRFIAVANPAEMAGVHRLTRALQDRIDLWIYLGYPEKKVELEIISLNSPASQLTNFDLELIYNIINSFRIDERVAEPPSIRASVSLASLYAKAKKSKPTADPMDLIYLYSRAILKGHTKFKALVEAQDKVREEIIQKSIDEIMET